MTGEHTREIQVDQNVLDGWGALSGDLNPLHVDPDFAAATQFGGTIAHGHYTLARMQELMLEAAGDEWRRGGTLQQVRFRAPVRPHGRYRLAATTAAGAHDKTWRLELHDVADNTLCAEAAAVIVDGPPWHS